MSLCNFTCHCEVDHNHWNTEVSIEIFLITIRYSIVLINDRVNNISKKERECSVCGLPMGTPDVIWLSNEAVGKLSQYRVYKKNYTLRKLSFNFDFCYIYSFFQLACVV